MLNSMVVNNIKIIEHHIALLEDIYREYTTQYKVRITQRVVTDISNLESKIRTIEEKHRRAHWNFKKNKGQTFENTTFPK